MQRSHVIQRFGGLAVISRSATVPGIIALAILSLATSAQAQYAIPRSVIANGGVVNSSGGGFAMGATIGQPVIGWTTGSSFDLHQGFWFPVPTGPASVDVPIVGVEGARNWPNPFSGSTTIYYTLPERSHVRVVVYNTAGELVRDLFNAQAEPGEQNLPWDGLNQAGERVGAGMYIFAVDARGQAGRPTLYARGKMMVVR